MRVSTVLLLLAFVRPCESLAADIQELGMVELNGDIEADEDISAVAVFGDGERLIIGADEGTKFQVLKRLNRDRYQVVQTISLVETETKQEIDIEGIAVDGDSVYIIGSHSRKRSKVKADKTRKKNRERLEDNELEPLRESLYHVKLNENGELSSKIRSTSLRQRLDADPVLKAFLRIPSKENGIDIEGVAVGEGKLYAAFRGPVLGEGFVPILAFEFDKPEDAKTLYVNLGGRGIRDIVKVESGFLLIGGPMGASPVSYELYFWDGTDTVPGEDVPEATPLESLGQIPVPGQGKAEGLTVLDETASAYEVLIVYDSVKNGAPKRFRVSKGN